MSSPLHQEMRRQDRHSVRAGLRSEAVAEGRQLATQYLEILDDAVMDDGDPVGRDRVGVGLGRQAMGSPSRCGRCRSPLRRLVVEPPGEVDELALGAPAFDTTVDQGGYAGRIIAAIFQAPEPFEKTCGHRLSGR
jgi:hypothetical protein